MHVTLPPALQCPLDTMEVTGCAEFSGLERKLRTRSLEPPVSKQLNSLCTETCPVDSQDPVCWKDNVYRGKKHTI